MGGREQAARLLLASMLLVGCQGDAQERPERDFPVPSAAIELWPEVEPECYQRLPDIPVLIMPHENVVASCGWTGGDAVTKLGCYRSPKHGHEQIVISWRAGTGIPRLLAHEFGHAMYECSGRGGSNDNHGEAMFQDFVEGLYPLER